MRYAPFILVFLVMGIVSCDSAVQEPTEQPADPVPSPLFQQADTTFAVSNTGGFHLSLGEGSVSVTGWDRNEIRVQAVHDDGDAHFEWTDVGSDVYLTLRGPGGELAEGEFDVAIPRNLARLSIIGEEIEVAIERVHSVLTLFTGDGSCTVAN